MFFAGDFHSYTIVPVPQSAFNRCKGMDLADSQQITANEFYML
ncbi:unnamed protein product [Rhodiola kirilowii]